MLLERERALRVLPLLVLLNKAELTHDGGLDATNFFELPPSTTTDRPTYVCAVSAADARNVAEVMRWLAFQL